MAVTCYLDESGTDNQSPFSVVAGLVMKRSDFLTFIVVWNSILSKHGVQPPLHMNEFGQHGKHRNLNYLQRYNLFADVAAIINCYKIISLAATLNQFTFNSIMTAEIRKMMGVYGMCFLLCAFINFKQANFSQYTGNIAFLLDEGNKHCGHVLYTHKELKRQQETSGNSLNIGSITFEDDIRVPTLQAADVIAWAVHRKVCGLKLGKGFQPISRILGENHQQYSWEEDWLQEMMITFKDSFNVLEP